MSNHDPKRFSLLSYASERQKQELGARSEAVGAEFSATGENSVSEGMGAVQEKVALHRGFKNLVEEMRQFLVHYEGGERGSKQRFSEVLHRAILGFPEERVQVLALINEQLIKRRIHGTAPPQLQYKTLAEALYAEIIGLNVLELILQHREGLEEIQVVGKQIFEVRQGKAMMSPYQFQTLQDVERIQQNLLLFNDDTMNPRKKWSEAMMSDGSRITLTGFGFTSEPTITIRFYTNEQYSLRALCHEDVGTLHETIALLLTALVRAYVNIVIIGGTNSGKTHLLKALLNEVDVAERLVTIESRRELQLKRDDPLRNVVEYEVDDEDRAHSSELAFKLALRQSPRRIIHAEIREVDANIYVRACTRGHEGSMTTLHASQLEDVPEVIADMCMLDQRMMNVERLTKRITQYVCQFGLQMALIGGQRKLVRLTEYDYQAGEIVLRDIVRYDQSTRKWLYPQPLSSKFMRNIAAHDRSLYEQLLERGLGECC